MERSPDATHEANTSSYAPRWAVLRRSEYIFYTVWIGGMLLALVLTVRFRFHNNLLGILWLGGTYAASVPIGNFRCPRCGELYFKRRIAIGYFYNTFTRKCLHCGLRKWQKRG